MHATIVQTMIGVLLSGQSLADAMRTYQTAACPAPHADTHLWNGTTFGTPTGDGMVTYLNWVRQLTNQPVYAVVHAVGGSALLQNCQGTTGYWLDTSAESLVNTAMAKVRAALASVPGLALDRIEWWQGQQDSFAYAAYGDIYSAYKAGLETLLCLFQAGLGTGGFRFCVWPVGRLPSGSSQQVVRAQMDFAFSDPATIEPGPSSHDQPTEDGTHLTPGAYAVMGRRGAWNAYSYFQAKAAGTLSKYTGGAGPRITSLSRNGYKLLIDFDIQPGAYLTPATPWANGDLNLTTNWTLWWFNMSSQLTLTDGRIVGGAVRLISDTNLAYPVRVGHAAAQNYAGSDVYDSNGQVCLPITPEMLVSA